MLAMLTRCVPQDFENPFVSAAIPPTIGVAVLIVWAGALWLSRMRFPQAAAARSIRTAVLLSTIAMVPLAAVTLWIWLQTRSFIPWCVPVATDALDAQYHSEITTLVAGWIVFALSLLAIIGSGAAAIASGRRRS